MNCPGLRGPGWRIAVAVCALGPAVALLCPPAHAGPNAVIWQGNDQSVRLTPQDDKAAAPNDHPATLPPRAIEDMLSGLRLRYPDQDAETPPVAVFNEDQVDVLGEALAIGLARAEASQDVTFSIVGAHRLSPGAFARRNRLTAGRVFFREGKLNLIFGEIQSPYRKKNIYGRTDDDFYPRKYGRRAEAEEHESILVANAAASLSGSPENPRGDWVVFDPRLAGVGRAASAPPATTDITGTGKEAAPVPRAPDTADIEQRLETLKRLREKALISEEAYRQKVDEILEDL